jgi:hypothetical protein
MFFISSQATVSMAESNVVAVIFESFMGRVVDSTM